MSVKVMSCVWEKSKQKGSPLLLLLAIADHAADDGYCWPSTQTLAFKIRMSVRSVIRYIQILEDSGELYVVRGNRNNRYIVRIGMTDAQLIDVLQSRQEAIPLIGVNLAHDDNLASGDNNDSDTCQVGTSEVTELCHPNHHEPSSNHQNQTPDGDFPPEESWPTESNFAPRGEKEEAEPITGATDYLTMAASVHRRTGGQKSWTVVGPEGANPWADRPVTAFCTLAQMPQPPPNSVDAWAREFEKLAQPWGLGPPEVAKAISLISKDDKHKWRSFTSPFNPSFQEVMDIMLGRVKNGFTPDQIRISND